MVDNVMHGLLCAAADQAGWDQESMMLHTTRFLDRLACDNSDLEQRFQDYLNEEVAFDVLISAEPCISTTTCPKYHREPIAG